MKSARLTLKADFRQSRLVGRACSEPCLSYCGAPEPYYEATTSASNGLVARHVARALASLSRCATWFPWSCSVGELQVYF